MTTWDDDPTRPRPTPRDAWDQTRPVAAPRPWFDAETTANPAVDSGGSNAGPPTTPGPPGAGGAPFERPSASRRRRRRRALRTVGILAAAAILAAGIAGGFAVGFGGNRSGSTAATSGTTRTTGPAAAVSQKQVDPTALAAQLDPAVVDITSTLSYQQASAAGTGMILTSSGQVLTNNHVVAGATSISVKLQNSRTLPAKVIGTDSLDDVALIQIEGASGLPTVKLADSSKVSVGEPVVAIGNALNLPGPPAVTQGTVTALGRSISVQGDNGSVEQLSNLIQTSATLKPGNSGGPLVDGDGRVVGMNTAASSGTGSIDSGSNEGYAIPISDANTIVQQIQSGRGGGNVHIGATAFLGVNLSTQSDPNAGGGGRFGGQGGGQSGSSSGAVIQQVVSGGPAENAGLAAGDSIVSFGGKTITTNTSLTQAIGANHPGDTVSIGWVDQSGQTHSGTVHLGTGPTA